MTSRMAPRPLGRARLAEEDGVVGGAEVLPFGLLVFVVGSLLLANAWGVIDGKLAASAAAREATRAFVESAGPYDAAVVEAELAARVAFDGHRVSTDTMEVSALAGTEFARCATATFEVTYEVPVIRLPWIGGLGSSSFRVAARHSELVDPYRDGVPFGGPEGSLPC